MRSVINISLPSSLELVVNQVVSTGKYASKSEFFRHLLRKYIETDLAKELERSRKELASGKGKLLSSLKDLR
jgi:Arc/MetJ-type ribon-helix-helix transcriptional regulator